MDWDYMVLNRWKTISRKGAEEDFTQSREGAKKKYNFTLRRREETKYLAKARSGNVASWRLCEIFLNLPVINHRSIVVQTMNGLRRKNAQPELLKLVLINKN
ncbi:MAG TPA: hypothetical protein VK787_04620 [Puia sp.]|jgi:hypothetical protein|nr:hypothetical protein [Puia sp.]